MIYGLGDRFSFGKHKGKLVSTVIREDPQYTEWCLDNVNDFGLDDAAMREYGYEIDVHYAEEDW